jgi:LysM repeat protein
MIFGLSLVLILLLTPASALAQDTSPAQGTGTGFYYVVRPGDTWTGIAHTVGVTVSTIKKYNPAAIHPHDYLWIGDRLWIPAPEPSHATTGYWYNVKQGNDWNYVSRVTGVPVSVLKAANPIAAADPHGWLYIGQKLWIPTGPPAAPQAGSGAAAPSVAMTAESTGATNVVVVPEATSALSEMAATPAAAAAGASTPVTAPTEAPAMAVVGTPTSHTGPEATPEPLIPVEPTVAATAALAIVRTPEATAAPVTPPTPVAAVPATAKTPAPGSEATPLSTPGPAAGAIAPSAETGCPADPAAFPEAIAIHLNGTNGDVKALEAWLQSCSLISAESGAVAEISAPGTGKKTVTVVIRTTPAGEEARGQLLVYHSTTTGYTLSHQVEGAGEIKLLKAEDVNADGKLDLVYIDTSCGAHTCFSTLFVDSWNGSAFQDWIKGEPTMAGAEYSLEDTVSGGPGLEILAHGGLINSAGAGPQRAWTETYISPESGPYESYKKAYDESSCLYFQILDANELFNKWNDIGFAPAIAAYDKAIADKSAKACGDDPDELTKLSDFARFRLVVSWVSRGRSDKAAPIKASITYPPLVGATDTFVKGLQNSHSIVQACRDTTHYAELNPCLVGLPERLGVCQPHLYCGGPLPSRVRPFPTRDRGFSQNSTG